MVPETAILMAMVDWYGPFYKAIGFELESKGYGFCRYRLQIQPNHRNAVGIVHGGVLYTLVDYSMAEAAYSVLENGAKAYTTDVEIRYLASVAEGVVHCETKVLHVGHRIIVLESNIVDDNSVICARASGSFYIKLPE